MRLLFNVRTSKQIFRMFDLNFNYTWFTYINCRAMYDFKYGPARIWSNNKIEYLQLDTLHREDGPAVINANGETEYFIDGRNVGCMIEQSSDLYFNE